MGPVLAFVDNTTSLGESANADRSRPGVGQPDSIPQFAQWDPCSIQSPSKPHPTGSDLEVRAIRGLPGDTDRKVARTLTRTELEAPISRGLRELGT